MTALSAFNQDVCPHVPECPLPVVEDAILMAVIDFCNRSRAYQYIPEDIPVIAGVGDYDVDLPSRYEIAWLLDAELDGAELATSDQGSIPMAWASQQGAVSSAIVIDPVTVGLRKTPASAGTLRLNLALRPSLGATNFPNELYALYRKHIASGALALIFAQPKKSWSDLDLAAYHHNRFEDAVLDAAYRADRGCANSQKRTSLCLISGR